jgi:hypothetical protein
MAGESEKQSGPPENGGQKIFAPDYTAAEAASDA